MLIFLLVQARAGTILTHTCVYMLNAELCVCFACPVWVACGDTVSLKAVPLLVRGDGRRQALVNDADVQAALGCRKASCVQPIPYCPCWHLVNLVANGKML